ncbi:hypothetical protein NLG97_g10946 [Lecanicillium saksenae]|uniref:Uncharacterized protein n=1 Tax=Lecanicillium saksenae TaxID=468837 RepID=A0ACC1QFL3_9HYPO|nr:hypothetical protein NLG97_g10946 [Lecanicillium saksenae]
MDMDEFSDDGLDDLPENALREIENQAIQFTQAQAQLTQQDHHPRSSIDARAQQSDYGWEEDDDLDTAQVVNDAGVPVGSRSSSAATTLCQPATTTIPPVPNPQWNPTLAQNSRPNTQQQQQALPPSRAGGGLGAVAPSQRFNPSQTASAATAAQAPLLTQTQPGDVLSALQIRIRALEYDLNAARGEASILRANSTKAQREFDSQPRRRGRRRRRALRQHGAAVSAAGHEGGQRPRPGAEGRRRRRE